MILRVPTPIYGVSKEIDRENIHFLSKPRHGIPQINHLGKRSHCSEGFQHTFMVFLKEIDGKMFIFRVNLGM